jgi:hypothetical protein
MTMLSQQGFEAFLLMAIDRTRSDSRSEIIKIYVAASKLKRKRNLAVCLN